MSSCDCSDDDSMELTAVFTPVFTLHSKMRSRFIEADLKASSSVASGEGPVPIHQDDGEEEEESEVRGGLGGRAGLAGLSAEPLVDVGTPF